MVAGKNPSHVVRVPTALRQIATIGVYGGTLESFLDCLRSAGVSLVLDVRQRRGVRGPEYAWANAKRLQAALEDAGLEYRHVRELAPTTELRQRQYAADEAEGVGKRSRRRIAPEYADGYRAEILDRFDLAAFTETLPSGRLGALLCVERDPEACHRSLIAERLRSDFGFKVVDLRP